MPWWPPSPRRLTAVTTKSRADAAGDVGLLAVDDAAAVDPLGLRADRGDVRAGAGLGDRQRRDQLAARSPGPDSAASAPRCRTSRSAASRCRRARRAPPPCRPSRTAPSPRRAPPRAGSRRPPAVALRVLQPEQPLGGQPEDLAREPARPAPSVGVGRQLALDEAADRLAQLLVLGGEGWVRGHLLFGMPPSSTPS